MILPYRRGAGRRDRERGAGLVLIIGIVAALAVSAATLVALTVNVRHNSSDTKQHVKSFTVCEAGLDSGMALLSTSWPKTAASIPTFDAAAFRSRFPASEFPDPASGQFIVVDWYDDQEPVDTSIRYDANGNGIMWMVAQAGVGDRATRLVSQVERTYMDMALPSGIALWAGGDLTSNGGGTNPKIRIDPPPPVGETVTVHVGGSIENPDVTDDGIAQKTGSSITPLDQIFPQSLVDSLRSMAQANGRYFTSYSAAKASPADPIWAPTGGLSGLCVIEPPAVSEVKITGNVSLNSVEQPGILMVLGGSTLRWNGTVQYYGVVYGEGAINAAGGTVDIHGMVISASDQGMKGTSRIWYNDSCIANLDQRFPSLAKRVQNTWREVQPQ